MANYTAIFTVQGRGPFPLDMLRRDECTPRTESDSQTAQDDDTPGPRAVTLVRRGVSPLWRPTAVRWESFGWHVVAQVLARE